MPAPQEILKLVERFEQNRESYISGDYKEAQIRIEFIDPFFKALGWDMNNEQSYAEAYKDVIHEDSIKIGSATEAPDYCFRIGGARKFFLEAKKPSVNIKEAVHPAYQLRRYAWSSKLSLSILTDFDEFSIYDCRIKPSKNDSPATGRIMYLKYNDYLDKWNDIASIFSRESILKGSFDKYAEGVKGKKGTASVDDSLLGEIENWRELLAKNIAIKNAELTTRELNFAVQKTIDRIIFLRICEDRGIEMYGKLGSFQNGENVYKRLLEYFRTADARYNSGLFHFQGEKNIVEEPDYLTQRINIDDKIFKEIIGSLYYPECPFEFSVLPADILGQVYERFLGKVIRLTAGHQAKVEEKPEVRKAGGVYYTPTYIVDYIVENTVGKLLWEFTAKTQGICDACGARVWGVGDRVSGLGVRGSGLKKAINKSKEYSDENIQRASCVAEGDGLGGRDIQNDVIFPQGGNVRTDKSDEKGGSFHTCKYCGRIWEKTSGRLFEAPFDSGRLSHGAGDSSGNCDKAQLHNTKQGNGGIDRLHRQDAYETSSIPQSSGYLFLNPKPESRSPKPDPRIPAVDPRSLRLRVADIACGSGSFLIVAYQKLLDWYLKKYTETDPAKYAKGKSPRIRVAGIVAGGSGLGSRDSEIGNRGSVTKPESLNPKPQTPKNWKLTINERKRILLEHIYGVDIDSQAVEVTKLSLLLKVLEGENEEIFQGLLFQERALPDLGSNIKCGNSLIGSDFYANRQGDLFNEDEMIRVNAFDWKSQFQFASSLGVDASKGVLALFDVVIGNPPYVRQETLGDEFKTYAQSHYKTFAGTADLYTYFIEKGVSLLRQGGLFSYIVANKWMRANYGKPLRIWLKEQCLEEITDFGDLPVFQNATTYPCILRIKKEKPRQKFKAANIADLEFLDLKEQVNEICFIVKKDCLDDNGWTLVNQASQNLLEKLRKAGIPLGEYVKGEIYRGVLTGLNEAFVIDSETRKRLIAEDAKSAEIIKPFLAGRDIKRYQGFGSRGSGFGENKAEKFLIFTRRGIDINNYPAILKHLETYKESLMPKPKDFKGDNWKGRKPGSYKWYEIQDSIDYYAEFEKPKIIYPNILKRPEFTYDDKNLYTNQKCFIIPGDDRYLLGILNSSVTFFLFKMILPKLRGDFYEPSYVFFKDFPIPKPDPRNPIYDSLTPLVSKMLEFHKKLSEAKVPDTKTMLQRQIEATDKEIDRLVYELYGLTADEIRIVEKSVKKD